MRRLTCSSGKVLSTALHNYGDVFGRRGARIARREEEECREHLTDEQRSEAGCIGGRYVAVIVKRSTKQPRGPWCEVDRGAEHERYRYFLRVRSR